ncbi:MAG: radical SAM protein, partial [Desulfobacterales bacterium]|nr:radical SAM protein [Desulfobacterales bacterium]
SLGLQSVKLTGGEPLLYRDIMGLLQFLASEDLGIIIETNGVLLDRSMVELLKDLNVGQISVSLDAATEALHDEIRGVRGSFRKTVKRLRLLSDFGLNFQVIMTLQRKNSKEIPALMRLCHELGASSLKINPMQPCGRAITAFQQNANLNLDELILLHRDLSNKQHRPDALDIYFDLPMAFLSIDEILQTGGRCWILNILGVLADGDYSICGIGQTADELRMGNLFRDSICEVWEYAPFLNDLRQSLPWKLGGICKRCIFKFQCLGACRANAFVVSKDLYAPYFLCQELYETGRFPASRYLS